MPRYSCFLVDHDGKLLDVPFTELPDDHAARDWAEGLRHRNPECRAAELWENDRAVWSSGSAPTPPLELRTPGRVTAG
jgi:hypothetical protein